MNGPYGFIEADTVFRNVIDCLNAKQSIDLWLLEKYTDTFESGEKHKINVRYVHQLYEGRENIMDYVVDYMRFDYDGLCIVIKPNKWMKME